MIATSLKGAAPWLKGHHTSAASLLKLPPLEVATVSLQHQESTFKYRVLVCFVFILNTF